MSMDDLLETIRAFDAVLELALAEGSEFPAVAWGDHFFYYAPDGRLPDREQPYATIVTKDYPDDRASDLDQPGRWRLNIHVGADAYQELVGALPRAEGGSWDYAAVDVVVPHPVYKAQGWVSIVNPGPDSSDLAVRLLQEAYESAKRRATRRPSGHR